MNAEQILADVEAHIAARDAHTQTLTGAADIALTRRMFETEQWLRYWADTHINLAGPVPSEYTIAVETAQLIMERQQG